MSSPSIARANDLAKRAEHCRQTGQPRLAALYEKNLRRALQQVKVETRRKRIQANPLLVYKFLCEDIAEGVEAIIDATIVLAGAVEEAVTTARSSRKSDFALVGPGQMKHPYISVGVRNEARNHQPREAGSSTAQGAL